VQSPESGVGVPVTKRGFAYLAGVVANRFEGELVCPRCLIPRELREHMRPQIIFGDPALHLDDRASAPTTYERFFCPGGGRIQISPASPGCLAEVRDPRRMRRTDPREDTGLGNQLGPTLSQ
jgi:hypothetical protein